MHIDGQSRQAQFYIAYLSYLLPRKSGGYDPGAIEDLKVRGL